MHLLFFTRFLFYLLPFHCGLSSIVGDTWFTFYLLPFHVDWVLVSVTQGLHFTFYPFICGLSSSVGDTVITFYLLPFTIIIHLCSSSCFYKVYLLPFTFHSLPIPVWTEIVLLVNTGFTCYVLLLTVLNCLCHFMYKVI